MVMAAVRSVTVLITPRVITWLVHVTATQAGRGLVVTKVRTHLNINRINSWCTMLIKKTFNNAWCLYSFLRCFFEIGDCNQIPLVVLSLRVISFLKNNFFQVLFFKNWLNVHLDYTDSKASNFHSTFLTPPVCSRCSGGGQPQQFDHCCHAGGHLPDWSHCRNHHPGVAGALSPPPLHHLQEKAEGQRAHHAFCDLHSCYEGHCWVRHCRYITGWPPINGNQLSDMYCPK